MLDTYDADRMERDRSMKDIYEIMKHSEAAQSQSSTSQRLSILERKVDRILEVIEKLASADAIKALVNCKKPKPE